MFPPQRYGVTETQRRQKRTSANPSLAARTTRKRSFFSVTLCLCGECISLGTRMCLVVHRQHVLHGELRITLRGRETLVTKHFLDRTQISAFLQHVRAKSVAQRMRMNIGRQSLDYRDLFHNAANAAYGQSP